MRRPPRFPLAALPTQLQRAERLQRALGSPPIYIKRDDLTGFCLAGNKARKLEFLVADALKRKCDLILSGGGPGSNHCPATAAAASVAGLPCVLIIYGEEAKSASANLALARFFRADVRFTGDPDRASVDRGLDEVARKLRAEGGRPYVIPRGGASRVGALGYAAALEELAEQLAGENVEPEVLVVATGSCGTQAGLVAGTVALGRRWTVVGASVSRPVEECRECVLRLAQGCADLLGWPGAEEHDIDVRDARGPGYGAASREGAEAARLAARTEGLLLDPVFTAKGLAALIALVREGLRGPAVFMHTGGIASALEDVSGPGRGVG